MCIKAAQYVLMGTLRSGVTLITGCSNDNPAPDTKGPVAAALSSLKPQASMKKGGGLIDGTIYPVPPGVKIGLEGGLKK